MNRSATSDSRIIRIMQPAIARFLIAIWAVVAMPTLCMGGRLVHACADTSHTGHACEEGEDATVPHDEKHNDGGKHESSCSADPCSQVMKSDDDVTAEVVSSAGETGTPDCPDLQLHDRHLAFSVVAQDRPPDSHHLKGRPYPDRDLPLLI